MNPNLLVAASFATSIGLIAWMVRLGRRAARRTRDVPAAPDNQPGTNTNDLWTCRHIANATNHARKEDR